MSNLAALAGEYGFQPGSAWSSRLWNSDQWMKEVKARLSALDPETRLSLVDCHI